MTQLVELLGPIAPYGALILIGVSAAVAVSAEIRRHRQDSHTRKLEGEKHDLETAMLKAQLHELSAQDRTYEALQRQVEEASEQAYRAGCQAAEHKKIEKQLAAARENLRRRREENEELRATVDAAWHEPEPRSDLDDLQRRLEESVNALTVAEIEVQELWRLSVTPLR